MREEVVSIIYQFPNILLGMKKNKFGRGKYNGFGGGLEKGETLEECVIRETLEEANIILVDPEKMGKILFEFQTGEQDHLVHFFMSHRYSGDLQESKEMIPKWFNDTEIPYDQMWADDKYWLPMLLVGKKFEGNFIFDENFNIVRYNLKEVSSLK